MAAEFEVRLMTKGAGVSIGMKLITPTRRLHVVAAVRVGGLAQLAGIVAGDELVMVNGQEPPTRQRIKAAMKTAAEEGEVHLWLRRGRTLVMARDPGWATRTDTPLGFILKQGHGSDRVAGVRVVGIMLGSPASRVPNLTAGDRIQKINGVHVLDKSQGQISSILASLQEDVVRVTLACAADMPVTVARLQPAAAHRTSRCVSPSSSGDEDEATGTGGETGGDATDDEISPAI